MIDNDIYVKIKLMIEKKIKSGEEFTYDEIYDFFLDENNGEITKILEKDDIKNNNIEKLNKINEVIKVLIGEDINTIYKQIYK